MEIKTEINRNLHDSGYVITSGIITIVDDKIVQFIQNEEQLRQQSLLDIQDLKIINSNKATYDVEYVHKYDTYQNRYNAKITITNGSSFYVKLNLWQRLKLKFMLKKCWIQKSENIWKVLVLITTIVLAIIYKKVK